MLSHDTQRLLQAGTAGALADAAAYLRRSVCADGPADGEDRDFALAERQWAAFVEWAHSHQRVLPLAFPPPEREGGREHDVALHEASGRWIKYTKPSACGYTVSWAEDGSPYMHNAMPLDYLQRLIWQNEVFIMPATPLQRLLAKYRATSQTEREKGSYFEELIRTYFRYEASYEKIDLQDLENSQIDWAKYQPSKPPALKPKKQLRPHQISAKTKVGLGFKNADRGEPKVLATLSELVAAIQSC